MRRREAILMMILTWLWVQPAFGADVPGRDKGKQAPAQPGLDLKLPNKPLAPGDYLSPDVKLSPREQQAVKLAREWENSGVPPVQAGGKVLFTYGASVPVVVGAPNQLCVVELQPGETVNEVLVGDSARWMCEVAKSGPAAHIVIKPVDAGLSTTALITTDRRAYYLQLVSQKSGHTPRVGFLYPDEGAAKYREKQDKEAKEKQWKTAEAAGEPKDLSQLNFSYEVKGDASWKPVQVFDDGRQTFIKLPAAVQTGDAPVLFARSGGQDQMVNYRMKNLSMIVDGIFPETFLISGVGSKQQRVTIRKK